MYTGTTPFLPRLGQIIIPIVAVPLFEIVMKQAKEIVVFIIILLFFRTIIETDNLMYATMIPEYRNIFHGILNILVFKWIGIGVTTK